MRTRSSKLSASASIESKVPKAKQSNIPTSVITRDIKDLIEPTGNLYESVWIIGKRARQISVKEKEELSGKLAEFASGIDNLEEIHENREQIEISRHYEKQPKPSAIALEEFLEGKLWFRKPDSDQAEQY